MTKAGDFIIVWISWPVMLCSTKASVGVHVLLALKYVSARRSPVAPLVRDPGAGAAPNCFSDRRRSITTHLGSVLHFLASPVYLSDCSPPPIYPTSKDHLASETTLRFRTKRIPSFCSRTAKYDVCDTKT